MPEMQGGASGSQGMAGILAAVHSSAPQGGSTPASSSSGAGDGSQGMAGILAAVKSAPKTSSAAPAPAATPTPAPPSFPGTPLGAMPTPAPSAQPFQTPATKILDTGSAAISSAAKAAFTPPAPYAPSLYDQAAGKVPTQGAARAALQGAASAYQNTPVPAQTGVGAGDFVQSFKDALSQGANSIKQDYKTATAPGSTPFQQLTAGVKTPVDIVNAGFGAALSWLQPLAKVPGLGYLVDSVNGLFSAVSGGATGGANDILQQMVNKGTLSSKTADTIRPSLDEITSLVAQLAVGEKAGVGLKEGYKVVSDNVRTVLTKLSEDPAIAEHIKNQTASTRLTAQAQPSGTATPIKISKPFAASKGTGLTASKLGSMKAGAMPPELRSDLRAAIEQHGPTGAHTLLMDAFPDLQSSKAEALVRNAPAPQSVAEETAARQKAMASVQSTDVQEPYTPGNKLPTIEAGTKGKPSVDTINEATGKVTKAPSPIDSSIDTIDAKTGKVTKGVAQPEVKEPTPDNSGQLRTTSDESAAGKQPADTTAQPSDNQVSTTEKPSAPERPVDENGQRVTKEPGVSKIGKSIEAKAVEANLTKGFKKTAGYSTIKVKDEAAKATDLVNNNIDQARAIVRGEEPVPVDMHESGEPIITAMEEYIKANPELNKDGSLSEELANSPLVSGTSIAAQTMRLTAERTPDSATAKLREIKDSLVKRAGKRATATRTAVTKGAKSLEGKINMPNADLKWDKFLSSIQC